MCRFGLLFAFACSSAVAAEPVSFYRDVRPIVVQNCQGCHQPARSQGGYVMTDFAMLMKPGETGKRPIVPGKPEESYLVAEIRVVNGQHEMPKNREALPAKAIATIEQWIREGAKDDTPPAAQTVAYSMERPPVYSAPPVVTSLAFSTDGQSIAVTGYHEILLFDTAKWTLAGRLVGLSERVQSLAWSPDGSRLAAVGGSPGRFGEVQIWEPAKGKLKLAVPVTNDTLYGASWAPDGSMIAFGCADNTVRGIDPATGQQTLQMGTHADWILGTTFSRDGKHLASVSRDMTMKLTEVATQRFIDNVTSITPNALKGGLMAVAIRPKTAKWYQKLPEDTPGVPRKLYDELLCAGSDGTPRLYKMHRESKRVIGDDANKVKEFAAMPGRISGLAFDANGQRFAAASSLDGKGEVRIYNAADGKFVTAEGPSGPIYSVAWQPGHQAIATAGFDGMVRVIDAANGKVLTMFAAKPQSPKQK
jgi:WD40 repeat protein